MTRVFTQATQARIQASRAQYPNCAVLSSGMISLFPRQERTKRQVLDDLKLANHLSSVHAHEPRRNAVPRLKLQTQGSDKSKQTVRKAHRHTCKLLGADRRARLKYHSASGRTRRSGPS
jgi:hypothetical protein